jgi:hypothetical protein
MQAHCVFFAVQVSDSHPLECARPSLNPARSRLGTSEAEQDREEERPSLQGRVCFVFQVRLQHGNYQNGSASVLSAQWRGLGIFAVAALTRLPNKHVLILLDLAFGMLEKDRCRIQYGNSLMIVQSRAL